MYGEDGVLKSGARIFLNDKWQLATDGLECATGEMGERKAPTRV